MSISIILLALAGLLLIAACITDVRRFEIPNFISVALLALAVVFGLLQPGFDWLSHAGAFALMFAIGLGIFAVGIMGGGDVKLLIAASAWTGLASLPMFLAGVMIAGGFLSLILLAGRKLYAATDRPGKTPGPLRQGAPLPYAIAIAAGAFWWAWQNWPLA